MAGGSDVMAFFSGNAGSGEGVDFSDKIGKTVAAVRGKVLVYPDGREEVHIVGNDFFGFRSVKIVADEGGNALSDDGIGINVNAADSVLKTTNEPKLRRAPFDQVGGNAVLRTESGRGLRAVDQVLKAVLRIFKGLEFRKDFIVFFF